jgi:hypothetical protein
MSSDEVVFGDVLVVGDNGLALKCVIQGREVWVGRVQRLPGSVVSAVGDGGRLVIPRWLAHDLGLLP